MKNPRLICALGGPIPLQQTHGCTHWSFSSGGEVELKLSPRRRRSRTRDGGEDRPDIARLGRDGGDPHSALAVRAGHDVDDENTPEQPRPTGDVRAAEAAEVEARARTRAAARRPSVNFRPSPIRAEPLPRGPACDLRQGRGSAACESADYARVNVEVESMSWGEPYLHQLYYVSGPEQCGVIPYEVETRFGEWYYDDTENPTHILLCETGAVGSCVMWGTAEHASVHVGFGCETLLI